MRERWALLSWLANRDLSENVPTPRWIVHPERTAKVSRIAAVDRIDCEHASCRRKQECGYEGMSTQLDGTPPKVMVSLKQHDGSRTPEKRTHDG